MQEFFEKLTDNIKNHDRIILMTHNIPDLDGMGSAIVFHEILKKLGKENYIVAPKKLINNSLIKAIDYLDSNGEVIPFKYEKTIKDDNDLLIIFDVEESEIVEAPDLLDEIKDKIVIDHHTKGLNVISDTILEYLDDKKSSTIEIVCEYLKYLDMKLDSKFYTIMLAGLYVDTNGFNLKTSSRTFEIASFLLENGADKQVEQSFLKISMESVLNMYSYIEKCVKLDKDVYLCTVDDKFCSTVEIAIMANKILKFEGVRIAFAIGMLSPSEVIISARSNGEVDVSKMMMKLGGGGHYSAAAAKVDSDNLEEVISKLKSILKGE